MPLMKPRRLLVPLLALGLCSVALILWQTRPSAHPASVTNSLPARYSSVPLASLAPKPAVSHPTPAISTVTNSPSVAVYTTEELLEKIWAALDSASDADHDDVFTNLLPALVRQDAKAAAQLAESLDPGLLRKQALRTVARVWAEQDADSACDWAAQLPNWAERDSTLIEMCQQLGQTDPEKALTLAGSYGVENGDVMKENLVQLWAEKDWAAALAWVNANPGAELQQDQRLARLAFILSQTSPQEAANLVVDSISPGFTQTEAAMSVLHQWGLQDLAGARAWLDQFPSGEIRQRGGEELNGITAYLNATHSGL